MNENKEKKFSMRNLIYNDKYLIIISIIAAVCIWIATSMNLSPETTKTITVPVNVDFSNSVTEELGIRCYGEETMKVDVTVRVKKYLAKDITSEDLIAKLQTNTVTTTGTHEVPISVTSSRENADFTVDSYYPTVYSAYFDVPDEQEMEIKLNYNTKDYIASGYVGGENLLNEPSVVVSGPKSYVSKVSKVVADVTIKGKLNETTTFNIEPKAVDVYGNKVDYVKLNYGAEKLTLTVPVLAVRELDVHASLIDVPDTVDLSKIKIYYSTNKIKAGVIKTTDINIAELGEISFSKLAVGENRFTYDVTQLEGITVLDSTEEIVVTVMVPYSYSSTDINVISSSVKLNNVPAGYKAEVKSIDFSNVTVIGPKDAVKNIKAKNLVLSCDLTAKKGSKIKTGDKTYKVSVVVSGVNGVWVYGEYNATVRLW